MNHADPMTPYTVQATVRSYESDADGLMKPEALLHWFQEIAENHASALGFGYEFVSPLGLAWVAIRMNVAISRFPAWKETVTLRTGTTQTSPLQAIRTYRGYDSSGTCIIRAECLWALIDAARRRPVRLQQYIPCFPENGQHASVPSRHEETAGDQAVIRTWTATGRDMDINRHINNAAYLTWALESLPEDWQKHHSLAGIYLHFRKESHTGEDMTGLLTQHGGSTFHQIMHRQEPRATVILDWQAMK